MVLEKIICKFYSAYWNLKKKGMPLKTTKLKKN